MNIRDLITFSADFMSPGAALAPKIRHHGVISRHMKKMKLRTRQAVALEPGLRADASPSDLASHHTWQEPSASDETIRSWRAKRVIEKVKRRNLEPFEEVRAEATKPCKCKSRHRHEDSR